MATLEEMTAHYLQYLPKLQLEAQTRPPAALEPDDLRCFILPFFRFIDAIALGAEHGYDSREIQMLLLRLARMRRWLEDTKPIIHQGLPSLPHPPFEFLLLQKLPDTHLIEIYTEVIRLALLTTGAPKAKEMFHPTILCQMLNTLLLHHYHIKIHEADDMPPWLEPMQCNNN